MESGLDVSVEIPTFFENNNISEVKDQYYDNTVLLIKMLSPMLTFLQKLLNCQYQSIIMNTMILFAIRTPASFVRFNFVIGEESIEVVFNCHPGLKLTGPSLSQT